MLNKIEKLITDNHVKFVDLRFTDTRGKEQHASAPIDLLEELLTEGKMFDGSSIAGWRKIHQSDMCLMPDPETAVLDPFCKIPTMILRCNVIDPLTHKPYQRDPRAIAAAAEHYIQSTGIADTCWVGPEPEFFIFDDVRWSVDMHTASYYVDSGEAAWNSNKESAAGNLGHRPGVKGGYFPVPPVDSSQDLRSEMCEVLAAMGLVVEAHHHEVATANQNEISTRCNTLLKKADEMQLLKYVIHNVAHRHGKTATFMAKPLVGDNGSGMHCHLSLAKDGRNLFAGDEYASLSKTALHFLGGIIAHSRALNAFTNPTTNSYKRLVPGFEAPVMLAYSSCNRSAAIRIPHTTSEKGRRIEVRFPDPLANPYLAFSALLMAGLDGIEKEMDPGKPVDFDLYEHQEKGNHDIPTVCSSLDTALAALQQDKSFLLKGDVFTEDFIQSYIAIKQEEIIKLQMTTHPVEFDMYYSL